MKLVIVLNHLNALLSKKNVTIMVNVIYKSQMFSQIFGNYHHKVNHFDRKKSQKKYCEILEGLI